MDKASQLAKERGAKYAIPLPVSGAFHSPLMDSAAKGLERYITEAQINTPMIPVIGNTTVQELTTADLVRQELIEQVCNCVQWQKTVEFLFDRGVSSFIEFGPGNVLTGLINRICPNAVTINIGNADDITTNIDGREIDQ